MKNESAQAIADRWNYDMSGWDAVIGEDGTTFYSFAEYRDAVEKAKNENGEYLSFADYIADESAVETLNRPYAVKYVLEDNRLGGTMMSCQEQEYCLSVCKASDQPPDRNCRSGRFFRFQQSSVSTRCHPT